MARGKPVRNASLLALNFVMAAQALFAPLAFAVPPHRAADLSNEGESVLPVQLQSEENLLAQIKAHPVGESWDAITMMDLSRSPYAENLFKQIAKTHPKDVLKYIFVLDGESFKDDVFCDALSRADLDKILADDTMCRMLVSKLGLIYENPQTRPLVEDIIQKRPAVVLPELFYLAATPAYKKYVTQIVKAMPYFTKSDLFSFHAAYKKEDLFLEIAKKSPATLFLWARDGGFLGDVPEGWIKDFQKAMRGCGSEWEQGALPDEVVLSYANVINELHEERDTVRFAVLKGASSKTLLSILYASKSNFYTSSYAGVLSRLQKQMKKEGTNLNALIEETEKDTQFREMIGSFSERGALEDVLSDAAPERRGQLATRWVKAFAAESKTVQKKFSEMDAGEDNRHVLGYIKVWGAESMTVLSDILGSPSLSLPQRQKLEKRLLDLYKDETLSFTQHCLALQFASYMASPFYQAEGSPLAAYAFDKKTPVKIDQNLYEKDLFKKGVCRQQVVFAFDQDSKDTYAHFLDTFRKDPRHKWRMEDRGKFLLLSAEAQGRKIEMAANKPEAGEEGLVAVEKYLKDKDWSVLVSRGHSYHFEATLRILKNNAHKIKFLYCGGCGGYLNRHKILLRNREVPFVATKKVGTMRVNDPVYLRLAGKLLEEGGINWEKDWNALTASITDPRLAGYLPPNKNKYIMFEKSLPADLSVFLTPEEKEMPLLPLNGTAQRAQTVPAL